MNLTKDHIVIASEQIGLTERQTENLWQALQKVQAHQPKLNLPKTLTYFGSLIAILAMSWFYTSHLKSSYAFFISVAYALIFLSTGFYFWHVKKLRMPGGALSSVGEKETRHLKSWREELLRK